MKKETKTKLIAGGLLVGIATIAGYSYVVRTMVPQSARGTPIEVISYLTNKRLPGCRQFYADVWL